MSPNDKQALETTLYMAHYCAKVKGNQEYRVWAGFILEHASMFSAAGEHETANAYDKAAADLLALVR